MYCCCTAVVQGGAGNESNKRQKGGMVEAPHQERFPDGSMSLEQVEQRFAELKQEVRRVQRVLFVAARVKCVFG
jgi:hypothetical protein